MALNIVLLGSPGAGKGTQAVQLAGARKVPKISTGDILREAVQSATELGRTAKAIMDRGELVSDDVMIGIVRERLARDDARAGFILDGFPRTVAQAEALDAILADRDPLMVLDIAVSPDEVVRRLGARRVCGACGAIFGDGAAAAVCPTCGGTLVQRSDDAESVVRERLKVYARDTEPLTRYYRERRTFAEIDGAQPADEVGRAVSEAVDRLQAVARQSVDDAGVKA
ncbi:MAG: adenylate kinase [Vicinamibacterales bacterium]|jgi:adenylate kinase|nr:adenylate kinase [Acidobacteriota bacterium]MDP7480573.1 adenylate kinase [Vicinamibacterales bacterium]MDP7672192.1 adenylate kinase [Vicinamibacterales bacterium]HJO37434.1 adenylate kinase [Vicinamibacterales bacterium]|tara:strand:- start:3046 stop:3726 length:681 start_codon:yes stop_codon:yes gene_type:complete